MNNKIKIRILIQNVIGFAVGFALMYTISFLIYPIVNTNDRYYLSHLLISEIVGGGIGGLVCGITLLFVLYKNGILKGRKGGKVLRGWILSLIVGSILLDILGGMITGIGLFSHFAKTVIYVFSLFIMGYIGGTATIDFLSETMPDDIEMKLLPLIVLWSFGSGIAGLLANILQNIAFSLLFPLAYPILQFDWLRLVQFTINGSILGSLMGLISCFVILRYYENFTKAISNL
jgi:hypothetical protein